MRILLVDDDTVYRRLLSTILRAKNHEVVEAADGKTAWELMEKEQFSFVITDWMMPGIDGPNLIKMIRAAEFPNYTYIILLTAKNAKEDIVKGLEAGADDFLSKPFDLDELRARFSIGERILDLETRLRKTMQQLEILATYDSLTGLLNRRALYAAIGQECSRSKRQSNPVCLIMLDIDHFKDINDQYGHLVGDQALCMVAETITQQKRAYDLVGRWGGEEFLLMLPETELAEAGQVAERLRLAINTHLIPLSNGQSLQVNASFGVARVDLHNCDSFDQYILQADRALYKAKSSGRNQVRYFDEELPG